ncbi:hypothetical protein EV11_0777 [Prochlorococcus sp. SS52]|nr:hypothetical protein EV04_0941 [Prochlorococcus marinus str. LG]KGG22338.1 hypothetical protein EV08_0156 [Prochlorococcus marinus str. SS2]KGG22673.1 hypothetical protein EV09_1412 [Prochlorococcus marinus str. SS35]KGG32905.1 hypothetical protein EV10_0885 [Prochlorococcus marinus str. SS51]KGG36600.1 hypothetical protein EV11_0777 [Prochlorococcus sp. SS52]
MLVISLNACLAAMFDHLIHYEFNICRKGLIALAHYIWMR